MNAPSGGRVVAWSGFLFGSVVSIAANVLHAWLPAEPPSVAAQMGAAVWPIALLLSVEAISRVRWRTGVWWAVARFGGLGVVGLGSFVISYGHLHEVLVAWGYTWLGAMVGPVVIDGLMVVSGFALLSEAGGHPQTKTAPRPKTVSRPTVADAVAEQPKPAPAEPAPVPKTNGSTSGKRAAGLEFARENWPVTGGAIKLAVGCSKGEADRIRAMVKQEKEIPA